VTSNGILGNSPTGATDARNAELAREEILVVPNSPPPPHPLYSRS